MSSPIGGRKKKGETQKGGEREKKKSYLFQERGRGGERKKTFESLNSAREGWAKEYASNLSGEQKGGGKEKTPKRASRKGGKEGGQEAFYEGEKRSANFPCNVEAGVGEEGGGRRSFLRFFLERGRKKGKGGRRTGSCQRRRSIE